MQSTPDSNALVVEMREVLKLFPGVVALQHVNFQLKPGEVHVLLGENGAGKSTLVKVLSGANPADDGEILIDGVRVTINNPMDSPATDAFDLESCRNVHISNCTMGAGDDLVTI